jgi:hypothetical protein
MNDGGTTRVLAIAASTFRFGFRRGFIANTASLIDVNA